MKGSQPSKRGKGHKHDTDEEGQHPSPVEQRAAMTGFCSCKTGIHAIHGNNMGATIEAGIQHCIGVCSKCGGAAKVIAYIEDPVAIDKILTHLDEKAASVEPGTLSPSRAPPRVSLFD